jgi:catechol 2,3-dioxygenase-like lactoylglutathione lyase family enzyme
MAAVKGIGGVFIDSQNAAELAKWYQDILGLTLETHPDGSSYYQVFATRDPVTSQLRQNPVFAINQAKGELVDTGRGFVLNLRVDDLDGMLELLRLKGVLIDPRILEWERGRHAWIHDQDGNRIELYEEILLDAPD